MNIIRLPNGYGSVHKLSGNRRKPFRVRVTKGWSEDNKQEFINLGCYATKKEALLVLAEYNKNPWDVSNQSITFADVFDLSNKNKEVTPTIRSAFNQYCKPLYNMPINEIKTLHLQNIIDEMSDKSVSTKKKVKQVINQVFKYSFANDIVTKNYALNITIPETLSKEKLHKPFTLEQIKDMIGSNDYHKEITLFLCLTGFRIDEALEIETQKIDLKNNVIIAGKKTKAGTDRTVPISKHLKAIIDKHYNSGNEYLFPDKKGKKYVYTTFRYNFNKIYKDNTTHDGRHTFATLMHNAKVDELSIQKIIGHSSGGTFTERVYTHVNVDQLKTAIEKLDIYIDKTIK